MGQKVSGICRNCTSAFYGEVKRGIYPQFCGYDCYHAFYRKPKQIKKRFWSYVDIDEPDECWLWTGGTNLQGYGHFAYCLESRNPKQVAAHRFAYRITKGKIPKGLHVLHHCDVPLCVNVNHLFLGTAADNMQDKVNKNRQLKGERIRQSKLTEAEVREIRRLREQGHTLQSIADFFGVCIQTVSDIARRRNWGYVV